VVMMTENSDTNVHRLKSVYTVDFDAQFIISHSRCIFEQVTRFTLHYTCSTFNLVLLEINHDRPITFNIFTAPYYLAVWLYIVVKHVQNLQYYSFRRMT